jgi:hypothetical protein
MMSDVGGSGGLAPINRVHGKTLCRVWYEKWQKKAKTIWARKVERSGPPCCWSFLHLTRHIGMYPGDTKTPTAGGIGRAMRKFKIFRSSNIQSLVIPILNFK